MNGPSDLSVLSKRGVSAPADGALRSIVPYPKPRWKSRVLLPGVVLLGFGALLVHAARDAFWPPLEVQVVPAVSKSAAPGMASGAAFQAAGWIESDPYAISVSALTDGVVKEVLVLEGQTVKAGDTVAKLVDEEAKLTLSRKEAEVVHHQTELDLAVAILEAAQSEWDNPIERERAVAANESLLAEARAELARLPAEVAVERAKADELTEQMRREKTAGPAIPEFQAIQTELRLRAQQNLVASVETKKPVLEAKVRQFEAELLAAKANLRLRITEKKSLSEAKAGLEKAKSILHEAVVERDMAKLDLDRMSVRAPAAGTVMARLVQPGSKLMLKMDDPDSAVAVKLYDPAKLQVRVDVPLADAARVSIGQRAKINVEVLRDTVFDGVVTRVVHQADIQKNTLQVKVAIEKPLADLKPEMLARVQFLPMAAKKDVAAPAALRVFIPENTIQKNGAENAVWIVDKGKGQALRRVVTLGDAKIDGWVEVTQGIQPGDAVITGDLTNIKEGRKVRIVGEGHDGAPASGEAQHGSH